MNNYTQHVRNSILPLSVGKSLPEAFEEWTFTDNIEDHGSPIETCELCGQEEVRYHFEIKNCLTGHTLWIGSQCILKFDISVFEDGKKLTLSDAKKKLDRLTEKMRLDACILALQKVAEIENNEILINALAYYKKNKYLTPKLGHVVFWRLRVNKIDYSPSFFRISLRKNAHKDQVENMKEFQIQSLYPALNSSQKKIVARIRSRIND